jgi:hypothetical protein
MALHGTCNLHGFVHAAAVARAAEELKPLFAGFSYVHRRRHNVYFKDHVDGLPADHGALTPCETVNHTLCDDQLQDSMLHRIYEWEPLRAFLARVLDTPRLYLMADPLARVNVIEYREGEALNWHFDRSPFTTTLLIQAADRGGEFEYRQRLRSDVDPNYDGVARVLRGLDPEVRVIPLAAGTLNLFAGKNTLHRVSTVRGRRNRIISVYSYYDKEQVMFSAAERVGFYGRAG